MDMHMPKLNSRIQIWDESIRMGPTINGPNLDNTGFKIFDLAHRMAKN